MKKENNFNGRIMHIDISRRLYQKGDSAIAYKIIPSNEHKGVLISNKLKKELKRDLKINQNYPKLHAIYIYYLIKEDLGLFDDLVICDDEPYKEVKEYLDLLFKESKDYSIKRITSLHKYRKILGDSKIRSYADNISNVYRRKAGKPIHRKQKGIPLNILEVNYQKVKEMWIKLKK